MTPSKLIKRLRIDDPDHFRLAAFDPADTGSLDKELEQVRAVLEAPKVASKRTQRSRRRPRTDDELHSPTARAYS
jgi:hypothetical protein